MRATSPSSRSTCLGTAAICASGSRPLAGAKWLHEAARIAARYRPGTMLYEIRDPLLGAGGVLHLHAIALHQTDGLIVRIEASGLTAPVEIVAAYGGLDGKRGVRDGDIGTEAVPIGQYFQLKPASCQDNEFALGALLARSPCAPNPRRSPVSCRRARSWPSPTPAHGRRLTLSSHRPAKRRNAPRLPVITARMAIPAVWPALLRPPADPRSRRARHRRRTRGLPQRHRRPPRPRSQSGGDSARFRLPRRRPSACLRRSRGALPRPSLADRGGDSRCLYQRRRRRAQCRRRRRVGRAPGRGHARRYRLALEAAGLARRLRARRARLARPRPAPLRLLGHAPEHRSHSRKDFRRPTKTPTCPAARPPSTATAIFRTATTT